MKAESLGASVTLPASTGPGHSLARIASAELSVVCAAVVVYLGAVANGFVLDDRGIIVQNPLVQSPATAWRAFLEPYWPAAVGSGQYRPLGILSFAIDRAIAGDAAWWYHLVNVTWHALTSLLVVRLASALADTRTAWLAGILFALHPVHVEAVANVVGRLELMAASFALMCILLHRRRSPWAVLALAAALFSKEGAVVTPILAWLTDRVPGAESGTTRPLFAGYAVVILLWGGMMFAALGSTPLSITSEVYADLTPVERVFTAVSVVPHHLRLLIVPFQLSADYEPAVLEPALTVTPMGLLGALIFVATVVAIVRTWHTSPVVAVVLGWVVVTIAPVSNIVRVTGVALAERTLYLPSVGVVILLAWLVTRHSAQVRVLHPGFAGLCLAFAWMSWMRVPVWKDNRTFALSLLEAHPESYRGHWVAGRVLGASGNLAAADRELRVARSIHDRDVSLLRESADLARAMGQADSARYFTTRADSIDGARRK